MNPRPRHQGPTRGGRGGPQRLPEPAEPKLPRGVRIVHEDADVLVVDKPPGLVSAVVREESDRGGEPNLFGLLKDYVRDCARRRGSRVWIIHRLDKEASGLLVFAKSERAFEWLKEDFRAKRVHRLYTAVVEGEMAEKQEEGEGPRHGGTKARRSGGTKARRDEGTKEGSDGGTHVSVGGNQPVQAPAAGSALLSGTIQSFLIEGADGLMRSVDGPGAARRDNRSVDDRGPKLAVTHYRAMAVGQGRTLVQVRLETGRKNQIRVHMRDRGRPLVGDTRYGAATNPIGRMCLHATELGFRHPATGEMSRFLSPAPEAFWKLVGLEAPQPVARPEDAPGAQTRVQAARPGDSSWNHVAGWYDDLIGEHGSDHYERVILPGTLSLLGARTGMSILDVACGQGVLARRLASLGARVVGVDSAVKLVESARRAGAGDPLQRFEIGDVRSLDRLGLGEAGSFDAIACVMALMNIEPVEPVFGACARLLRPGGVFVGVILHPAFRSPGQTSWEWEGRRDGGTKGRSDEGREARRPAERQYRRVDGYLSAGQQEIVMNPGGAAGGKKPITTITYHRPVQTYIRLLSGQNFLVNALEEWPSLRRSEPGPRADEENRARREIPMFLAFRAVKAR